MQSHSSKPEVMSPAGYWPQLHAAIEAGADAVYFGLKHFTARAKVGFALGELPELMRTLHGRGVRGYLTFNTLVFEHEVAEAARAIAAIASAGVDAVIVQDIGIVKLVRSISPDLEIHASTQMSVTDAAGVRLAQEFGVDRVTLARELSLDEVRRIRAATGCELEIFVHGALCVAYSGQCFSSEAWGGRSANRGQCAQACRLPYELLVDGGTKSLGDARYLLSPGDLYTLHQVPEIVNAGVSALKIEGRYKDADYVALTTRAYRRAVDAACEGRALRVSPVEELQLEQVYSRGLAPHFLSGTNHQAVVNGRAPRHRGLLLGKVDRVTSEGVLIDPATAHRIAPLKPGDGVVFDAADWRSPEENEEGGRVYEARNLPEGKVELRFGNGALNPARIRPGDLIWRTHDPDLDRAVRPYTQAAAPVRKQPVRIQVTAHAGQPLRMEWSLVNHLELNVTVMSPAPLDRAQNRGMTEELLREQLTRLGHTAYEIESIAFDIEGSPFAPQSLLNQLRRDAVELLTALQTALPERRVLESSPISNARQAVAPSTGPPTLHVLVRTQEQLGAAIGLRPASITLDFLDLYGIRPSLERVCQAGLQARVASPRVLKPGEEKIGNFLLNLGCPILVRPAGLLHTLRQSAHAPLIGDFSLNAANAMTASAMLDLGLERITPTYDLNAAQIATLARSVGGSAIEALAYGHLPVFHTEHCVFCRFLSTGTSYRDCGRPCEKHQVAVRDTAGRAHPVIADVGCRNTVFGAEAQEASAHLEDWLAAGIRHFRIEFVHESAAQVERVVTAFRDALLSGKSMTQLQDALRRAAPQGITEGSLFVPRDYLTLPVLQ